MVRKRQIDIQPPASRRFAQELESDLACERPVTEAELDAIERLLGDDLHELVGGQMRH